MGSKLIFPNGTVYEVGDKANMAKDVKPAATAGATWGQLAKERADKISAAEAIEKQVSQWAKMIDTHPGNMPADLRSYYREKIESARDKANDLRKQAGEDVVQPSGKTFNGTAQAANNPVKRVNNSMANETQRKGFLAQADAEDNAARDWDRKAEEKMAAVLRVNDRALVDLYTRQARDYRANAELCRERAKTHRRAAAVL